MAELLPALYRKTALTKQMAKYVGQFGGRCCQSSTILRIPAAPEESVGRGTASKTTEVKMCVKGNSVHDSYLS
jgi:hypothetical protein